MDSKLAIVILNYNGAQYLRQFLAEVVAYSSPYPVIVADNNSTDESRQLVETTAGAQWLALDQNYGFAEGYNQALKKIKAQYFLLLNSDVKVSPHWLEPLLQFMDDHPRVAACQPKIRSFHQPTHFEYAGAAGGYLDFMGVPFCRGRLFDTLEEDVHQYDQPVPVHWASGACLMIRAELYWKAKGLDGRFFAHMEEIDLCWRLRRMGHEIWCVPSANVYHVGGGTLSSLNPRKTYLNYRNGWWMLMKNLSALNLIWILPLRLLVDWLAALRWLASGKPEFAGAILKAHLRAIRDFRPIRGKYQHFSDTQPQLYSDSIIKQYFLNRVKFYKNLPNKPA